MSNKLNYNDRELKEFSDMAEIAKFFGFRPFLPPEITKHDFDAVKNFEQAASVAEKASLIRMFFEEKSNGIPLPAMLYCDCPFPGTKEVSHRKKPMHLESSIICLGSMRSVCECLSIQAALSVLHQAGHKNLEVRLNSVGDKDSLADFQRNLTIYIRKNINSFPSDLRQMIKKDPLVIIKSTKEEWQTFRNACPKPLDFLSEASRIHFKEILEFLEVMDIPYSIDNCLLADLEIGSETIFAVTDSSTPGSEILASGIRFNRLAKKIGFKKELPSVMLNLSFKLSKKPKIVKNKAIKPKFYLIQFGNEAKLQSFLILREFHKAKVPIVHSLDKDKLAGQISVAENSGASYIVLIGQKEALDRSVVIRNIVTRAQQIVPIAELAQKVKELSLHNS